MKWILAVIVALVLVASIAALIGSRLPRNHVAAVMAHYNAPVSAVWTLIGTPAAYASWRTELKSLEMLPNVDGKPAWRETSSNGKVDYVLAESEPARRMVTRITNQDLPYGGQWEFALDSLGTGAVLTVTERGFVKPALFRFLARYVFGYTGALRGYHRALGAKLGITVSPQVVADAH